MTPNISPIIAAAAAAKKRRELFDAFRKAAALTPDRGRTMQELGVTDSSQFQNQIRRGAIIPLPDNRYYLDEESLKKADRLQYGGMFIALAIVALVIAWMQ